VTVVIPSTNGALLSKASRLLGLSDKERLKLLTPVSIAGKTYRYPSLLLFLATHLLCSESPIGW